MASPAPEAQESQPKENPPVKEKKRGPAWLGEAWARDDGMVLALPVFTACGPLFKRMLLRAIRVYEYEDAGKETWWDFDNEEICTLETLAPDRLPPFLINTVGQKLDPGDFICKGGDYDCRLVVVLKGTVEKLVGNASQGGRCITRVLERGDCDGLPEFLGVGNTQQRTCALRAGPQGAVVRYVARDAIVTLLKQTKPGPEEDDDPVPAWPEETEYFRSLALDRIDSLHHKASKELLSFKPHNNAEPLDFMTCDGQGLFMIDNALGTSVSGPLPEGIEERYFFDGQTVIKPGVQGDCLIMILRGEVEALVPEGCNGQCLPRQYLADQPPGTSWLGDGRCPTPAPKPLEPSDANPQDAPEVHQVTWEDFIPEKKVEIAMVAVIKPTDMKRAKRKLSAAAEAGRLDLRDQTTTDWRWSWDDPRALVALEVLKENRLLSPYGEDKYDEVHLHQNPPKPPPPPMPQALMGSGTMLGHLALLKVPIVFSGVVRAKGPVHLVVLHRHVLLEALQDCSERAFFEPNFLSAEDWIDILSVPLVKPDDPGARPAHLGPNTGPPKHIDDSLKADTMAGTYAAWKSETGPFAGMPGADALEHVLANAIRGYALIWDLIHDAPPRLLDQIVKQFEPRWLLPNETLIVDEEPDADFLFVVIHGDCVVRLEGAEIDHIGQGAVQGAAQLLTLNDWTRTVIVEPSNKGEAMIQVLKRSKLVEILAGHPVPKIRLREAEDALRDAKKADWRILRNIPAFGSTLDKKFLMRVYKDADIRLVCPGDYLARKGEAAPSLIVLLAGQLRSEQAQTLFYVELNRGDWCFQNNILGIEPVRAHDVVAVTHSMVMVLYRHTLLNAIVAFPQAREAVMDNETWRRDESVPQIGNVNLFGGVPLPVLARLEKDAAPRYFKSGSVILAAGQHIEEDQLFFILRGEVKVSIFGIVTRTYGVGQAIGVMRYLGLNAPSNCEYTASEPCDMLALKRETMAEALEEEKYEDDLMPYKNSKRVLGGGEILDAFGFPVGGGAKFCPECVEKSEIFSVCSPEFVRQIPQLVEELAFWPGELIFKQGGPGDFMFFIKAGRVRLEVLGRKKHEIVCGGTTIGDMACLDQVPYHTESAFAETHVWVRALHKPLLKRALSSFPEEERRLMGAAAGGADNPSFG